MKATTMAILAGRLQYVVHSIRVQVVSFVINASFNSDVSIAVSTTHSQHAKKTQFGFLISSHKSVITQKRYKAGITSLFGTLPV